MGIQDFSNIDPNEEEGDDEIWIDDVSSLLLHNQNEYGGRI